ncbi:putative Nuclease S1 [Glarea lozoyensis 74030]|uniref:Putative Nuclease S1 n=1 Tax=Glarea lozoyensis (strain ATCC 74030 / MF5533) TaxID=1104152 RepID=H0EZK4_GLAL7|nr:putative Nuclease S1 [Glarea lozoyensis 74030]
MKNLSSISLLILASAVQKAACWGALGHYTVGYIASNFVTNATQAKFQAILGDTSADYLASVAAYKFAGTASFVNAKTWATNLTETIKYGAYSKASASWLDGLKLSDPVASSMVWARDTNSYVCSAVLPDGRNATEAVDLGGEYYAEALPVVQLQIAKAGYSLRPESSVFSFTCSFTLGLPPSLESRNTYGQHDLFNLHIQPI